MRYAPVAQSVSASGGPFKEWGFNSMAEVYVLKSSSTGKIYIGCTNDIEKRLLTHNGILPHDKKSYTYKQKGPWVVVYSEKCNDMTEARKREKYLKSGQGREFLKRIMRP